jgi:cell wall-associated NlpC family hydrolase
MKKIYLFLIVLSVLSSCKSTKTASRKTTKTEVRKPILKQANAIVEYAKKFKGVKYKYGGTTKKGMDCSGLIYTTFKAHDIVMPRTTKDLSVSGNWVDLKKVTKGDLVFFATNKNSRKVNHVGIVTNTKGSEISFIHSSSSRGVMISQISQKYWYFAFVQARRYL